MGREGKLVQERFARGCRCFAVVLDGAIAGYGWLSTGPEWIGEVQSEIRPRKAESYIWNCVTLAGHRRKGIFKSLVAGISEATRQTGVGRVWIGSVAIPAEKALRPLGFQPAAHFRTIRFAGLFASSVRFVDGELGRDARSVLQPNYGFFGAVTRRKH
jgi:hypothetical protein